jgi:hypothetical protein
VICTILAAGAAGDAAKDFLDNVNKQAGAVAKQAEVVKQAAAAAVEDVKGQVRTTISLQRSTAPSTMQHARREELENVSLAV